ncbi:MAG: RidA family protein [Alphaproteobacteria bacterium]|nr:RidA family protein [Alphaproteobacteria bacterium]TAD87388.1 MAG: RidA family protein [Alphaproteobacteria bacterium]
MRRLISTGSPFEAAWGYSRAVVDGDMVYVSGCTGFDYATMTIADDATAQAEQCWRTIGDVLAQAGASLADVLRVTTYVTDAADWPQVGAVMGVVMAGICPAATALVCGLVDPRMKVEIEVTARIGSSQPVVDSSAGNR